MLYSIRWSLISVRKGQAYLFLEDSEVRPTITQSQMAVGWLYWQASVRTHAEVERIRRYSVIGLLYSTISSKLSPYYSQLTKPNRQLLRVLVNTDTCNAVGLQGGT